MVEEFTRAQGCKPSTQEAEAGELRLHGQFKAILSYKKPCQEVGVPESEGAAVGNLLLQADSTEALSAPGIRKCFHATVPWS